MRLLQRTYRPIDRPLAGLDAVCSEQAPEERNRGPMVRIREEVFPDDRVHPGGALAEQRCISREVLEKPSKVPIPDIPDAVAECRTRDGRPIVIGPVSTEKLLVRILDRLWLDDREVSYPRSVLVTTVVPGRVLGYEPVVESAPISLMPPLPACLELRLGTP